eukprot:GHUV01024910.1.p1 GENE.GHUV01024910.1~~GHUV01024910.1.p1  ORF type:complete len:221 (+),score=30.96 GHUV01024910.1:653-1315(+)
MLTVCTADARYFDTVRLLWFQCQSGCEYAALLQAVHLDSTLVMVFYTHKVDKHTRTLYSMPPVNIVASLLKRFAAQRNVFPGVRAPQFMSLLVKAMRSDVSIKRVAAFCKRLLQVACHAPSNWAAGALLLLSEVLKSQPGLWAAVQQPEDTAGQIEHFLDVPAGTKTLRWTMCTNCLGFVALDHEWLLLIARLLLLSEVLKSQPRLWAATSSRQKILLVD